MNNLGWAQVVQVQSHPNCNLNENGNLCSTGLSYNPNKNDSINQEWNREVLC